MSIKAGDIVICLLTNKALCDKHVFHDYIAGDAYIVTRVQDFRIYTSDGNGLWNSWMEEHFKKTTKLEHLLMFIKEKR